MSYNYLPLDRKRIKFQQVKNLLQFDQLVSITFDAHEKILESQALLKQHLSESPGFYQQTLAGFLLNNHDPIASPGSSSEAGLITGYATGLGEPLPLNISKLAVMLKIKSLGSGTTAVHIETVKRLMDLYNAGVFPVLYSDGYFSVNRNEVALAHLSLPLFGLGSVYHGNEQKPAAEVLQQLAFQPLQLQPLEASALLSGSQFVLSFALYVALETEKLLKAAGHISAVSSLLIELSPANTNKPSTVDAVEPQENIASIAYDIQAFQQIEEGLSSALETSMKAVNTPAEFTPFHPTAITTVDENAEKEPLLFAYDTILKALAELGEITAKRIEHLHEINEGFTNLLFMVKALATNNKDLILPYTFYISEPAGIEDRAVFSNKVLSRGLALIENVTQLLAIELVLAARIIGDNKNIKTKLDTIHIYKEFRNKVVFDDKVLFSDTISLVVDFIRSLPAKD